LVETEPQSLSIPELGLAYDQLIRAFAELEKNGKFVAAAHVAAAIEAIDPHKHGQPTTAGPAPVSDAISCLAEKMHEAFGEAAEAVARRQLISSCGATLSAWAAITNRLSV
jgi:hypothetical protein